MTEEELRSNIYYLMDHNMGYEEIVIEISQKIGLDFNLAREAINKILAEDNAFAITSDGSLEVYLKENNNIPDNQNPQKDRDIKSFIKRPKIPENSRH